MVLFFIKLSVNSFTLLPIYPAVHNTERHRRKVWATSVLRWEI